MYSSFGSGRFFISSRLAVWISEYYAAPLSAVMGMILPTGVLKKRRDRGKTEQTEQNMIQKTKAMSKQLFAVFASLCLMLAMLPAVALADDSSTGTVSLTQTTLSVESGESADVAALASATNTNGDYHLDYVASNGAPFTINKHAGGLLANTVTNADQTGTVTVYLLAGNQPSGNNGKPCTGYTILDQKDITVTVRAGASTTYDYQGTGFQIKLTSPTVTNTSSSTVSGVTTYTNTVSSQTAGDTVLFTYYQNAGLNQYLSYYSTWGYNSPEAAYKDLAGQYISYTAPNGSPVLLSSASSAATVTSVTSTSVTISVPVGSAVGTGVLSFDSGLHTFKQSNINQVNKTLGDDINFTFAITSAGGGDDD